MSKFDISNDIGTPSKAGVEDFDYAAKASKARVVRIDEGEETIRAMTVKGASDDFCDHFSMLEGHLDKGELIAPHTHALEDQCVLVLSDSVVKGVFGSGENRSEVVTFTKGEYLIKPRGLMHSFWCSIDSEEELKYIEFTTGTQFDKGYVRESLDEPLPKMDTKYTMFTSMADTVAILLENEDDITSVKGLDQELFDILKSGHMDPDLFKVACS